MNLYLPSPFPSSFLSSSFHPPLHCFSAPCHGTVRTRDVAAAHQHAVDFDSGVSLSLSLCDAISDYIVITNALGVCSQQNMGYLESTVSRSDFTWV